MRKDLEVLREEDEVLHLSEIFTSIQGEGKFLGVPSLFIRTAICNLRCSWCDTKYSWAIATEDKRYSIEQLLELIEKSGETHVIFTGGEPMLQYTNLSQIIGQLDPEKVITFETNGTIVPHQYQANVHFSVSPKLSSAYRDNSENKDNYKVDYDKWKKVTNVSFKFVLDLNSIDEFIEEHYIHLQDHEDVFVQYVSDKDTDLVQLFADMRKLADQLAMYKNIRVLPRMHLLYYGGERGY